MKKKGFTLVELLAVIAILAILAVVAMTSVPALLKSVRKNSFMTEVQTIINQAKTDYILVDAIGASGYTFSSNEEATKLNIASDYSYEIKVEAGGKISSVKVGSDSNGYYVNKADSDINANSISVSDVSECATGEIYQYYEKTVGEGAEAREVTMFGCHKDE